MVDAVVFTTWRSGIRNRSKPEDQANRSKRKAVAVNATTASQIDLVLLPIGHRRSIASPASRGGMLPEIFIYVLTIDLSVYVFPTLVIANSARSFRRGARFRRLGRGTWWRLFRCRARVSTIVVSTIVVPTTAVSISVDAESTKA